MVASHTPRRSSVRIGTFVAVRGISVLASGLWRRSQHNRPPPVASRHSTSIRTGRLRSQNNWVFGPVSGIGIDARDHVILIQRNESDSLNAAGGTPAPHVVELDSPHDIMVDSQGNRSPVTLPRPAGSRRSG
jgi:hypothetical protein